MTTISILDDLHIADVDDAKKYHERFDVVVSLTRDEQNFIRNSIHCPLRDGRNEQSDFDDAVDTVLDCLENDERTLVHCEMGISRAPTVVTTAIASRRDLLFEEAYDLVWDARPNASPHPELVDHAMEYLDEEPYDSMAEDPV